MPLMFTATRVDGALVPASALDKRLFEENIKPGKKLFVRVTQARSSRHHRFYFALIRAATYFWPDNTEPNPGTDEDLLRAWLQCKAGWHLKPKDFPVDAIDAVIWLMENVRGEDKYSFVKTVHTADGPMLRVYIPTTVNYDETGEEDFAPVVRVAVEIIEATIGASAKEILLKYDEANITRRKQIHDHATS
jgi:hypothetical protein